MASASKGKNIEIKDNEDQEEILRFMQDLEFVQCLANPYYLKYLSKMGYLDDEKFINYLKYLLYFKKAEYMKYITYERCILFLDLLQFKEFREKLKDNSYELHLNNFILNDWVERNKISDNQVINENPENKENNNDNENKIINDNNNIIINEMDLDN